MVNRLNSDNARNSERHPHDPKFTQQRTASTKTVIVDDVITSLANAHENRRARQVTEWQRLGAQTFRAAA